MRQSGCPERRGRSMRLMAQEKMADDSGSPWMLPSYMVIRKRSSAERPESAIRDSATATSTKMASFPIALATAPFRHQELNQDRFISIGDLRTRCAIELGVPLERVMLHKVPLPPTANGSLQFDQEHQEHILELADSGRSEWTEPDFRPLTELIEPGFMVLATEEPDEDEVPTGVQVPWSPRAWTEAKRLWELWGRTIVLSLGTGILLIVIEKGIEKVWTKYIQAGCAFLPGGAWCMERATLPESRLPDFSMFHSRCRSSLLLDNGDLRRGVFRVPA
ncbi:hypothetical protein DFJ74DRAFT_685685 [Hyaloraphidium curvatum]|nr:hypothetical protein DFJ74DRAFT_685685 [Hyaloraphidium curvatum]